MVFDSLFVYLLRLGDRLGKVENFAVVLFVGGCGGWGYRKRRVLCCCCLSLCSCISDYLPYLLYPAARETKGLLLPFFERDDRIRWLWA